MMSFPGSPLLGGTSDRLSSLASDLLCVLPRCEIIPLVKFVFAEAKLSGQGVSASGQLVISTTYPHTR